MPPAQKKCPEKQKKSHENTCFFRHYALECIVYNYNQSYTQNKEKKPRVNNPRVIAIIPEGDG